VGYKSPWIRILEPNALQIHIRTITGLDPRGRMMGYSSIPKRFLGKTGLEVTAVSAGGFFFDEAKGTQHDDAIRIIQRAIELGVNYYDTAPYYGNSQKVLGEALADRSERCVVSTKCGRFDWKIGPYREEGAYFEQLERSLKELRRDHVDILYLHEADWPVYWEDLELPRPNRVLDPNASYDFENSAAIKFLRRVREQGLAKHLGISGNNAHLLAKLLREMDLDIEVVLVAFQYDPIWRNAKEYLLPVAREYGVGVVLGAPLQQGRLALAREEWIDCPPPWMGDTTKERFRLLYEIVEEYDLSLPELTLRFLLADDHVGSALTGLSSIDQLEDNVRYAQSGPLPHEVHLRVEALGRLYPGVYRHNARQ
jgi:aryl-alcohol dehydrogenase-like predicted oxidoreductase